MAATSGATMATIAARNIGLAQATPSAGGWTFTDDKGVTVTLPERPTRIVADVSAAAPLWDFGIQPIAVFGWTSNEPADSPVWGAINKDEIEIITGEVSGPDLEKLIALKPDLVITLTWEPDNATEYWSLDTDAEYVRVQEIAPLIAIAASGSAAVSTDRFAELAGLLGADLESTEITAAKTEYEAATEAFKTLAAEKSDLTSLFLYADPDQIYVASFQDWADLAMYESLGLSIVDPGLDKWAYWETLSWEQALKYPADVVFQSTRLGTLSIEELEANEAFKFHPAAAAGQVGPWNQDFIMSYQGLTAAFNEMIAVLKDAQKVT
ncbi:MAG: ABC transporter substrate-binding protein [Thermomicrobiales bacterium]